MAHSRNALFVGVGAVAATLLIGFTGGYHYATSLGNARASSRDAETPLVRAMRDYGEPKSIKPSTAALASADRQVVPVQPLPDKNDLKNGSAHNNPEPTPASHAATADFPLPPAKPQELASLQTEIQNDARSGAFDRRDRQAVGDDQDLRRRDFSSPTRDGDDLWATKNRRGKVVFEDSDGVQHIVRTRSRRPLSDDELDQVKEVVQAARRRAASMELPDRNDGYRRERRQGEFRLR